MESNNKEFLFDSILFLFDYKVFFFDYNLTMVPTTRALWYLPHASYGSYHNVVLENKVISIRELESLPYNCKYTQNK